MRKRGSVLYAILMALIALFLIVVTLKTCSNFQSSQTRLSQAALDDYNELVNKINDGSFNEFETFSLRIDDRTALAYFEQRVDVQRFEFSVQKGEGDIDVSKDFEKFDFEIKRPAECSDNAECLCLLRTLKQVESPGNPVLEATQAVCRPVEFELKGINCQKPHKPICMFRGGLVLERNLPENIDYEGRTDPTYDVEKGRTPGLQGLHFTKLSSSQLAICLEKGCET